jgi:hypothetical protein
MHLKAPPKTVSPVYFCPVCYAAYSTKEEAKVCLTLTKEPVLKPGDVIPLQMGYTWFDGDPDWVIEHAGYKFHDKPTHVFWFVVRAIDYPRPSSAYDLFNGKHDAHMPRYSVVSKAMNSTNWGGWTRPHTHKWFDAEDLQKWTPPDSVLAAAPSMIGRPLDNLL